MITFAFISAACTKDHHCADGQACLNSNVCTCSQDADCASTESCQNGECQEVTCNNINCGSKAQCVIGQNEAVCECESGYYAVTTPDAGCGKTSESCHYVSQLNPT